VLKQQQQQHGQQQWQQQRNLEPPLLSMNGSMVPQAAMQQDQVDCVAATAAVAAPAAAAAAAADDTQALLLSETAAVIRQACLDADSSMVQLQPFLNSVRSNGLAARLGHTAAAAASFLQCWPDVFVVQQGPVYSSEAAAGKHMQLQAQHASVGLQEGAVDALMQTQHFNRLLQEYRQLLLKAATAASAAGGANGRRGAVVGIELGRVGVLREKQQTGLMPEELLPYKLVSAGG
jgi:hypothetical protein